MPSWGDLANILTAIGVLASIGVSLRNTKKLEAIQRDLGVTEGRALQKSEDAEENRKAGD